VTHTSFMYFIQKGRRNYLLVEYLSVSSDHLLFLPSFSISFISWICKG